MKENIERHKESHLTFQPLEGAHVDNGNRRIKNRSLK